MCTATAPEGVPVFSEFRGQIISPLFVGVKERYKTCEKVVFSHVAENQFFWHVWVGVRDKMIGVVGPATLVNGVTSSVHWKSSLCTSQCWGGEKLSHSPHSLQHKSEGLRAVLKGKQA